MAEYGEVSWVRLPTDLKEKIQALADVERRTLTSQIVVLLEKAIADLTPQSEPVADVGGSGVGKAKSRKAAA